MIFDAGSEMMGNYCTLLVCNLNINTNKTNFVFHVDLLFRQIKEASPNLKLKKHNLQFFSPRHNIGDRVIFDPITTQGLIIVLCQQCSPIINVLCF